MNDLQKAILDIQLELKAPKNQYNTYAGFYYRNAEDIVEALKPLLKKHGIFQKVTDEVVNIGEANYVKATVVVKLGDFEETTSGWAREEVSLKGQIAAQITGGASSYAKKYALNGMYNIDDTKDADSEKPKTETPKVNKLADADDIQSMMARAKEVSGFTTKAEVLDWFNQELQCLPNEVPKSDVQEILDEIEAKRINA